MIAQSQVIAKILCRKAQGGVFTKGWKDNARGPCLGFWKESKRNTHRKGNTFYKKICRTSDDLVLFDLGLVQPNPELGVIRAVTCGIDPEIGRASCRERVCQYVEISVDA